MLVNRACVFFNYIFISVGLIKVWVDEICMHKEHLRNSLIFSIRSIVNTILQRL